MALKFTGTVRSKTDGNTLELYPNQNNEIYINIDLENGGFGYLCLDKETSIQLSKQLRKYISFLKDEEVKNGRLD